MQKKINLAKSEDKCKVSKVMMKIEKKRNISAKTDLGGIYKRSQSRGRGERFFRIRSTLLA